MNIKRVLAKAWLSLIAGVGYCIFSLAMNIGRDRTLIDGLIVTTGGLLFLALILAFFGGILWLTVSAIKVVKND